MHHPGSLLFLLLIPFFIWNMRRRLHRVRKRADHLFQPSGENFIYQPRGRWGGAFIVSTADRETIKRKMTGLWVGITSGLALVYILPLLLAAADMDHYLQYRQQMIWYRLGAVALIIMSALVWHRLTIWPIYASAERSTERISIDLVRSKIAADTSWAMLAYRVVILILVLAALAIGVWFQPDSPRVIVLAFAGFLCFWALGSTIRLAAAKSRR